MAKMQEFKCPCCGGSIEFDSSVQKMKCPFCDTEFDVGTLSEYAQTVEEEQPEDMSWSDEAGSEWQDGESEGNQDGKTIYHLYGTWFSAGTHRRTGKALR